MRQDRIYVNSEGKPFYFIPEFTNAGITIFIFDEEPSKHTEEEQAVAIVTLAVEESDDATRVLARLYDDETEKAGDATHVITLIEEAKEEFTVHWFHTGKFEATYRVKARSQEDADAYVAEHRLELEPVDVFPLSDDYQQFL